MSIECAFVPPLIVKSDDGLALFGSVDSARVYLEVPDVEDGLYGPAYDAQGRLITIRVPAEVMQPQPSGALRRLAWNLTGGVFAPVEIEVAEEVPAHERELMDLLREVLEPDTSRSWDREALVALAIERFGPVRG